MKKNVTYIDACEFEKIIVASGLTVKGQAGFVKVSGAKGRNVYVARTKTVGRVDISGFTVEHEGIRTLDEDEAFGNVKQQLDFSRSKEQVLEAFTDLLEHLLELGDAPASSRTGKMSDAVGWTTI